MAKEAPRFALGSWVTVRSNEHMGHCRTPAYIKSKTGIVEAVYGPFNNPEDLAYGGEGLPRQRLYRVIFLQQNVWGNRYDGATNDTICVDLYEHWLETA